MSGAPWPGVSDAARKAMRANKGRDTKPELAVRRMVHAAGYRYRLHRRDLPGSPDLVFGPRRRVVFVHGCFWHSHDDGVCTAASVPKTRAEYWGPKLARNRERDAAALAALARAGWQALVVWECQLRDLGQVLPRVSAFLERGEGAETGCSGAADARMAHQGRRHREPPLGGVAIQGDPTDARRFPLDRHGASAPRDDGAGEWSRPRNVDEPARARRPAWAS